MMERVDDIKQLIPQREPFLMVHACEAADEHTAYTTLTIEADNYFILPDGTMSETGVMEHIAQSAAALIGCQSLGGEPRIGLIGEVKHFECRRRPLVGEQLSTTITITFSMGSVSLAQGECRVGGETLATAQLKIFIQS